MKKRVFIIGFFVLALVIPLVSAAQSGAFSGILPVFKELGQFLFKDLPALGDYGFKFLLWIALFALMNYGLKKATLDDKTAGITAFVISLLSVLLIPGKTIQGIFSTYAVIITFILGVIIPLLLVWLVNRVFPGNTTTGRLLRGVSYLIVAYALFTFTSYVQMGFGGLR